MEINARSFVDHCVSLFSGFDPALTTVDIDTYIDKWIEEHSITNGEEAHLLSQIFNGCIRQRPFLDTCVSYLFKRHWDAQWKALTPLYQVLTFLAFFHLEELTFPVYRKFITTQNDYPSMLHLVEFLFDSSPDGALQTQLCLEYESDYVELLFDRLNQFQSDAEKLIRFLNKHIQGAYVKPKLETTKTLSFSFAPMRIRDVEQKEECFPQFKAKAVPKRPYKEQPKEFAELEKKFDENRKNPIRVKPFALETKQFHSERRKKRIEEEILAEKESEIRSTPQINTYVPHGEAKTQTKTTTAMILREEYLHKRRIAERENMFAEYEKTLYDNSESNQWQNKEETTENFAPIITHNSNAIEECWREKQQIVEEVNEQKRLLKEQREQQRIEDEKRAKEIVTSVQQGRQHYRQKKENIAHTNQDEARRIKMEQKEAMSKVAAERQAEQEQKLDLIRKIKAMEKVLLLKTKTPYDVTQTSGLGLLEEMSILELRDRLAATKQREEIELAEKRSEINQQKRDRKTQLEEIAKANEKERERVRKEETQRKNEAALAEQKRRKAIAEKRAAEVSALREQGAMKKKERQQQLERINREQAIAKKRKQFTHDQVKSRVVTQ